MRLSSSLRKAIQGNQLAVIVVNGLGKALQPLGCPSAPLALQNLAVFSHCSSVSAAHLYPNPNNSPRFWLKVLSKEEEKLHFKAGENKTG